MKNEKHLLAVAEREALKSTLRVKVSFILFDYKGRVVAKGYNHLSGKGHMGRHSKHAEKMALDQVRKPSPNLDGLLFRKGNHRITPCAGCKALIEAYKIRKVYYSDRIS
jgi:deoxycytidylate deaminase